LYYASYNGNEAEVRSLIQAGANVNHKEGVVIIKLKYFTKSHYLPIIIMISMWFISIILFSVIWLSLFCDYLSYYC